MNITVIAVGKIKESFFRDAITEYQKRLGRYCRLEIIEVADEPVPEGASDLQKEAILKKEAERILKRIPDGSYTATLEIKGEKYDSEGFAGKLQNLFLEGKSRITFIIGGSLGLHKSVSEHAQWKLSFSDMTFPHQMMRVILTEQLYRAFRIINGEPYHK